MKVIDPGHFYQLDDGTQLKFRREAGGAGATTCELLEVLHHRIVVLDERSPCPENLESIMLIYQARCWQKKRAERIAKERESEAGI